MTATDAADVDQEPAAAEYGGMLPPYSAEDAVCPMCQNREAFTWFRPALPPNAVQADWNGGLRRGGRPKRLERECARCTYKWDEALVVDRPGMTIDALVHALDNATPYPVELDREVLKHVAHQLLAMLYLTARPDHPLWQYSNGRPPAATAPQDPAASPVCEAPHATRDEEDACERRRLTNTKESSR
ncbi:hypothetical protein ACFY3M_13850 [Streptomyces mirabilis]|uniref:hypothetical protein n=1 Tax=Streptomyces mirabilis TaxID=68239 RepID=UPI0036885D19